MLFRKKNPDATQYKELIDNAKAQLDMHDAESDEYNKILNQIERLEKLSSHNKEGFKPSPDVMVGVLGNLAGILLILNYERLEIVTTKALGFVIKSKI